MRGSLAILGLAAAIIAVSTTVSAAATGVGDQCRIVAGAKYLGQERSSLLCSEIMRAIAAETPGARYRVTIKALSPTRLTAELVVNGKPLPAHKFAVMDAQLDLAPMQRFARAIAGDVATAVKK